MSEDKPKFTVSVTQVVASALAATTAAVLASYLGVAGTIAGAALASVVVTIGSAFYRHQLDKTRARLRASALADLRARSQRQAGRAPSHGRADADVDPADAVDPVTDAAEEPTVPAVRRITPVRVTVVAVAVFALSIGIITTIEAFAGEPISDTVHGRTGGSRFSITDTGTRSTPSPTPTVTETQAPRRSESPSPSSAVSTPPTGSRTTPSASTGSTPGQSTASAPAATPSPAPTDSGAPTPSAPGPTGTPSQPGQ